MSYKDTVKRIGETPWKGMIAESGIGTMVSHSYLCYDTKLKTILGTHSFLPREEDVPASKEYVSFMINSLAAKTPQSELANPRFYLAYSYCHKSIKDDRDGHGWMALKTIIPSAEGEREDVAFLHINISRIGSGKDKSRILDIFDSAYLVGKCADWLMRTLLLGDYESWIHAYNNFDDKDMIGIDVIDDTRISTEQHLELVSWNKPVVYHNGKFHPAMDYISKYTSVVGGEFNQVTNFHSSFANDAIFIINFENQENDSAAEKSTAHKLRMLDLIKAPALVTNGRPLLALQVNSLQRLGVKNIRWITTIEEFNSICNTNNIPASKELFASLNPEQEKQAREEILTKFLQPVYEESGVTFDVYCPEGQLPINNEWSKKMKVDVKSYDSIVQKLNCEHDDLFLLAKSVSEYVTKNNL